MYSLKKVMSHGSWVMCLIFIVLLSSQVNAQQTPPHEGQQTETGVITGTLLKDGKVPLPGQMVTLDILRGHELVLSLPKQTDQNGTYQFKNIFRSPDFQYAISSKYEGKIYRSEFVSLKVDQQKRELNLIVGQGAIASPKLPPPLPGSDEQPIARPDHQHVEKKKITEYHLLAVILSLGAIGVAIYQKKKA